MATAEDRGSTNTSAVPYSDDIPLATISSSPIQTNQTSIIDTDATADCIYKICMIDIEYVNPQNVLQMPITGNVTTCSFANTAAPIMYRVVTYQFECSAGLMQLPAIDTGDPNDVLLSSSLLPGSVDLETDGQNAKYFVKGRYVYGYKDMSKVTYYQGVLPWVNIPFEQTAIQDTQFVPGLTSPITISSKSSGVRT